MNDQHRNDAGARHRRLPARATAVLATAALAATGLTAGVASASATRATRAVAHASHFLACEVTDTGGINDRSFNASAYLGLQLAAKKIPGLKYTYLSSTSTSDYTPNINALIAKKCGIIITVGFDMASATQTEAKAHPGQKFSIVDFTYAPALKNVLALHYDTDQDGFLGGYLAAAMSKTGKVGTFGGQDIPTVTIYMDGFVAGVRYYDKLNHAHVVALGWNPAKKRAKGSFAGTGVFTNDFTNQGLGKTDATTLMAQGADVIFPVAGSVGLGAAAAVKQAGPGHYMEWVDTDGCISAPQYCSLFLTSVTKGIAPSVEAAVVSAATGKFKGGNYNGTLANNGVSLSPFHTFANKVPAKVKTELVKLKAGIIAGKISTDPNSYPAS
ncbi:MAG TPA: BMP family ABC transporter substrate-binding protein [Acidimicrobiales bacterium]|nr:BMP family ABC transporter substrate-binding protein [Acidimicrobiales bacterium]